ncbi:TetR/AcrR family transcriptional regulator [Thalassobacillus sp. C254]|uniref:TetR/AcrR family transcriptional regulator n=1 Tax=Thalassobacillus sp. C254 TaxID=1225341 RepID=UPI0022B65074|nr:helix-turn-helix domain-containing protein [Thalassobacillus sp. C254]
MTLREKKAAKKKEEILRSALKIISKSGYHGATMDEIAAELLMTKGALYYYFPSKEDLLFQSHNLVLSDAMDRLEEIYEEDLPPKQKIIKAIFFSY